MQSPALIKTSIKTSRYLKAKTPCATKPSTPKLRALRKMLSLSSLYCILGVSIISCAEEVQPKASKVTQATDSKASASTKTKTELLPSGDIFIHLKTDTGITGSYISTIPSDAALHTQHILWILQQVNPPEAFIDFLKERLPRNRRFKKENFVLPLVEENGNEHRFEYISDNERGLYTLNYHQAF